MSLTIGRRRGWRHLVDQMSGRVRVRRRVVAALEAADSGRWDTAGRLFAAAASGRGGVPAALSALIGEHLRYAVGPDDGLLSDRPFEVGIPALPISATMPATRQWAAVTCRAVMVDDAATVRAMLSGLPMIPSKLAGQSLAETFLFVARTRQHNPAGYATAGHKLAEHDPS